MAHPYFNDFRNSFIQFTKVDLNWLFDQWMETEKGLDYSIGKVEKIDDANYTIEINRKGNSMEMPLDISVDSKFGIRQNFHIPNKNFIKETKANILPKWTGFGKLNQSYTFSVYIPDSTGIKNINEFINWFFKLIYCCKNLDQKRRNEKFQKLVSECIW